MQVGLGMSSVNLFETTADWNNFDQDTVSTLFEQAIQISQPSLSIAIIVPNTNEEPRDLYQWN